MRKAKLSCFLIILGVYALLGILRGPNVGLDTSNYSRMYINCRVVSFWSFLWDGKPEFLYFGLTYIFSNLYLPEICFYILEYGLIGLFLFLALWKEDHSCLILLVFFFFGYMAFSYTAMRQAIAVSVLTYAFSRLWRVQDEIKIKDIVIFYVFAIIAIMFHKTAFVALPLPILFKFNLKKNFVLLPLLFLCVLPFFSGQITVFISQVLTQDAYDPISSRFSISLIFAVIIFIAYVILVLYTPKPLERYILHNNELTKKNQIIFDLFYAYCLFICFNSSSQIYSRLGMYFSVGLALIVANMAEAIKSTKLRISFSTIAVFCVACYFIYSCSNMGIVPYEFVF